LRLRPSILSDQDVVNTMSGAGMADTRYGKHMHRIGGIHVAIWDARLFDRLHP